MSVPASKKIGYVSVEEYLVSEERSSTRHEYIDGQLFAMSGVTKWHNIIAGNIHSALRAHVRGSQCRAYVSDVKARVEAMNSFYYPDVMVSCEAYDRKSVFTDCPVLIVEVLSRSTAAIDRREKVLAYKKLESLREYMIVHQSKQCVELHRKSTEGSWEIHKFIAGDDVELLSLPVGPLKISMNSIYEDVDFDGGEGWLVREDAVESYGEESGTTDW
jgi:Uma2 family endonuclease